MTMDIDALAGLHNRSYREVIEKHIDPRTADPDVWAALVSRRLANRTMSALRQLIAESESANLERKQALAEAGLQSMTREGGGPGAYRSAQASYEQWKTKNRTFRRLVEQRLGELKDRQREYSDDRRSEQLAARHDRQGFELRSYRRALQAMTVQIQRHQAMTARSGRDPEQEDYDLWRLLDELSVPVGERGDLVPLRSVLRVYWQETTPATVKDGERAQAERLMKSAPGGRSPRFEGKAKAAHVTPSKRLS